MKRALPGPSWLWLALLFGTASGLQSALASRLGFLGGQPDFLLTLTLTAALMTDTATGAAVGFAGGLLTATVAGSGGMGTPVGTYIVSRTLAAWIAAWATGRFIESRAWVVVLGVGVGTLLTELFFVAGYPQVASARWLRACGLEAAFNAALAIPAYLLLRRVGWGQRK